MKISIISQDGRENDLALLAPGDCFGEMSILDGGLRSASAVAADATETMTLSREDFLSFITQYPYHPIPAGCYSDHHHVGG